MIYRTINKIRYIIDYYKLALMTLKAEREIRKQNISISYDELIKKLGLP